MEITQETSGDHDMSCRSVSVAFLQRFTTRNDGGTAVELAMVAMPFFSLMFAIFEIALVYLGTSSLDNGLTAAARQIRTGQAQTSNMTAAQFRQLVCDRITPLLACDSRLVIDVRRFGSFGGITVPPPLDAGGNFAGGNVFQSGAAGDIIVARAYYAWPLVSPTSYIFSNMTGNAFMLSAATAFRNEPF
jgi:Flp pilus assembly protein TadG